MGSGRNRFTITQDGVVQAVKVRPRTWRAVTIAARDGLGSVHSLRELDLCFEETTGLLYRCTAVTSPTSSVWAALSGGGGGGGTLDDAYDFGGPGGGRTIVADAGSVQILGNDGLRVTGDVAMGGNFDIFPETSGQGEVGTDSKPFGRIRANEIVSGDLVMRDDVKGAHWRIYEEPDRLIAKNEITGQRFQIALIPEDEE